MAMSFDLLLERMHGDVQREIFHDNFTRESVSQSLGHFRVMGMKEVQEMFPGVSLSPSEYIAYLPAIMCHSLPVVNKRGKCFTFETLKKSAATANDALIDVEHQLIDNGIGTQDSIVGHIKAVRIMQTKELASGEPTPVPMYVLMALHTRSQSVREILEQSINKAKKWRTSMECAYRLGECDFLYRNEFIPAKDAPSGMLDCMRPDHIVPYKGHPLALALGGRDGKVDYFGLGITASPADKSTDIMAIVASEVASNHKDYRPISIHRKPFSPGNNFSEENYFEIAQHLVDSTFHENASIEVLGTTEPAEDGHIHDVLNDGTVMPTNGHSHCLTFSLVKGTTPRLTGKLSETTVYPRRMDGSTDYSYQAGVSHTHLVNIPLRGKNTKSSSAQNSSMTQDDAEEEASELASRIEIFQNSLAKANIMPQSNKLRDILKKFEAALSPGKSGDQQGAQVSADVASILTELREFRYEDELSEAVKKEIANQIESGEIVSKAASDAAVAEAVKQSEEKAKAEALKAKTIADRIAKISALGVDVKFTEEGKTQTIEEIISAIPVENEAWYNSEYERLKTKKDAETAAAKLAAPATAPVVPAATTAQVADSIAANATQQSAASAGSRSFLIGQERKQSTEVANQGAPAPKKWFSA